MAAFSGNYRLPSKKEPLTTDLYRFFVEQFLLIYFFHSFFYP